MENAAFSLASAPSHSPTIYVGSNQRVYNQISKWAKPFQVTLHAFSLEGDPKS